MSEIIYLYISRAKDDTVAENLLIYVYPPYTFRITEIKYIYLTPILHTYTSHSIRRHTLYTSSTQPIRVYAYCVDTHWHAAHYSPPTFDRPRSKRGDSSETSQRWRRSRQKKICSWATQNTNTILPQQTNLKHVGVNDVMTEYYEISHSSIQSEEVLYPTHWDIPAIRRAFELFIDFNRCFFNNVYHASITHGI